MKLLALTIIGVSLPLLLKSFALEAKNENLESVQTLLRNYKQGENPEIVEDALKIALGMRAGNTNIQSEKHLTNAKLDAFAAILSFTIKHRVDRSKLTKHSMNVAPPLGAGVVMSGMSPEAIKDDKLRAEYVAAIEANNKARAISEKAEVLHLAYEDTFRLLKTHIRINYQPNEQLFIATRLRAMQINNSEIEKLFIK